MKNLWISLLGALACNGGTVVDNPDTPFGLDARPANPTCVAPPRPADDASVGLERVYPNLSFSAIVALRRAPGDASRWYALEQDGQVLVFDDDPDVATTSVALDISDRVRFSGEAGLLGIAFHPDFATNGELYLHYDNADSGLESRISRFVSSDGGATFDRGSEEILFTQAQPYGNHNGGDLHFGPDGYLYTSLGDGGSGGDPLGSGQDLSTVLGAILRIDVDVDSGYRIPDDNPFVDTPGARGEIWAYGLRNVWRFGFDPLSGDLWAGDVGQNQWEEVDLIVRGGNYGWNAKEGTHCFAANPCDDPDFIDPVAEYSHSDGRSVTGGFVYRGSAMPELFGAYVYADFYPPGKMWGVFYDAGTGEPIVRGIGYTGLYTSAFAQDLDGELYALDYGGGIYKLVRSGGGGGDVFPQRLSQTGCVEADDPAVPVAGMVPYGVNLELWSDGAVKRRWAAIPDGLTVGIDDDGHWTLPVGSVALKTFEADGQLVETRLLVRHDDGGWAGYAYKWEADGSDAVLVQGGASVDLGTRTWRIPSSAQCLQCHTVAAGGSLGLETAQLNGDFAYPTGRTANQVDTLLDIGFVNGVAGPEAHPSLDAGAEAGRAYLHVQCAHCHRPGANAGTDLDLRWQTPLADMEACNQDPEKGDLGYSGAKLVAPGDPAASLLSLRMKTLDEGRMPTLASDVVHDAGVAAVDGWISGLSGCE